MLVGRSVLGVASLAGTVLGADQVTSSGPDLSGIALLITAVSGLIATIGALVIGLRKKPVDPMDAALREATLRLLLDNREDDPREP